MALDRQHLGAQMRDAGQEVSLYRGALPEATSVSLAALLLGCRVTSPASPIAVRVCSRSPITLEGGMGRDLICPAETVQLFFWAP
jgi:hypothetical protein